MAKEELLEFKGVVTEILPNAMFRVKLEKCVSTVFVFYKVIPF